MHQRFANIAVFAALAVLLSGCGSLGVGSSEFGCAGMPEGVSCLSARQVYELTNTRDHVSGSELAAEMAEAKNGGRSAAPAAAPLGGRPVGQGAPAMPVSYTDDGRVPIRTPAVVMRLWIAPYQDSNGDLHMPGFLFTEVEPRKWQVGLPDVAGGGASVIRPLEGAPPKEPSMPIAAKPPAKPTAKGEPGTTHNMKVAKE